LLKMTENIFVPYTLSSLENSFLFVLICLWPREDCR
jgi:hypothetical protein